MNKIVWNKLTLLAGSISMICMSQSLVAEGTKVNMSGYVQLDGYYDTVTNDTKGPRGYDLISYRSIPLDDSVGAEKAGGFKMHARSSRIAFGTSTPYGDSAITTKIEGDFFGRVDAGEFNDDDSVSNSYEFRLRQAYVKWGNWLAGQTWSNFVDLKAYPEGLTLDSVVGRPFGRQAQVRYTSQLGGGSWLSFSLENSDTDFNKGGVPPGSNSEENDTFPDAIVTYFNKYDKGHFRVSGLFRQLGVDTTITAGVDDGVSASTIGIGAAVSGSFSFSPTVSLRYNLLGGNGIGRYLYNNQFRGAILDVENEELEAETAYGGNFNFQYKPSKKFRLNIAYGMHTVDVDEDLVTSQAVTTDITSLHLNGIWTLGPGLTAGAGLTQANRTVLSGDSGDFLRVMFNVKKKFSANF